MKTALVNTKATVTLRKAETRNEWYLYLEAYPVFTAESSVPQRTREYLNRTIATPLWDKSRNARTSKEGNVSFKPKRDINGVIQCKSHLDQEACIYADKVREIRQREFDNAFLYTDTDSEVLVHGFEEWKEDMLPKLRGMFGFAIYNTKDNSLFIARDFFGIKPMHYTQIGDDFVYASEIKSILEYPKFEKKFNRKALDSYLSFQYAVPPETFFEGVYCLMPGHYLWYKDGEVETTRYFEAQSM